MLDAAALRSAAVAQGFRESAPYRALDAAFAGIAADDVASAEGAAQRLLGDAAWVGALLAPLFAAARDEPFLEPPLRVNRDGLRIGAVLFDCPAVSIAATILSADALAGLPPPRSVVVPGRLSVVRYVRGGGARLRLWHAGPIDAGFAAATARPCAPAGTLPLADGVVLRIDGRTRGHLLEKARGDVVTLTATIRPGAAPLMREYALPGGALIRTATLDDRASRARMLLGFLRLSGRSGAGACFDAATRDEAFFLRWAAMREWLALDAAAALPRLREMAACDAHAEIRAAAGATLAMAETRYAARAARSCHA